MSTFIDILGHVFIVAVAWLGVMGVALYLGDSNPNSGALLIVLFMPWSLLCAAVAIALAVWRPWA